MQKRARLVAGSAPRPWCLERDRRCAVHRATHHRSGHAHPEQPATTTTASPAKWAELLQRVWGSTDALECPTCKGRMTAMAVVENAGAIARYLAHAGQATVHPRAEAPPDQAG